MTETMKEVLQFVRENDVKFIRLAFCDLQGNLKNVSIMPGGLEEAFESGISFDASAIAGFSDISRSDLMLFPDPATLNILPWRPQQGRVIRFLCNIREPDGRPFTFDVRAVLNRAVKRAEAMGFTCNIGTECEFYLFKTDSEGQPTLATADEGGYCDVAPLDQCENIRREICLCLEEMGLLPLTSHHEQGPGQNEVDFRYSDALSSADNFLTFKYVVKNVAQRNGLYASFMPKPLPERSGNGLHINLSLSKSGRNIFEGKSSLADGFIAGILDKAVEMCAFLCPTINSYERLGKLSAPKYVSWSHQNRSQLVRIPAAAGEKLRIELREPDPAVNPYLAFALILTAGLDGIEQSLPLPDPIDADLYSIGDDLAQRLTLLPESLPQALALAQKSELVQRALGEDILDRYICLKRAEAEAYQVACDKAGFIRETYFKRI